MHSHHQHYSSRHFTSLPGYKTHKRTNKAVQSSQKHVPKWSIGHFPAQGTDNKLEAWNNNFLQRLAGQRQGNIYLITSNYMYTVAGGVVTRLPRKIFMIFVR